MNRYWSELARELTPYVPGEQPRGANLLKLNTNESPYGPSPRVLEAIAAVGPDDLRRYPDPESIELRRAIASRHGLQPEQVFPGNGSDEVLATVFQALLKQDQPLCFPDLTYSFYPVWCELYGIRYRQVPLLADFSIDVDAYPVDNGGIILANPNAPTGRLLDLAAVRRLLERNRGSVVVIDEAYIDYGGESAVSLVAEFDNLLVVRTLSKSSALAGLRVGFALGDAALVQALQRVKNSFNSYPLDVIAQRAALAAVADDDYYRDCCRRVADSRQRLSRRLQDLGFEVLPSAANFLLARHRERDGADLFRALRERGIIVRYFDKPRIRDYLRITVGTETQCERLLAALGELLQAAG